MTKYGNWVVIAALAAGCGSVADSEYDRGHPAAGSSEQTFSLGSRGPEVARANAYLRTYGYFPNDALAAQFPDWKPVVLHGPSAEDVLDEHTAVGLSKFQTNFGLPSTGVLDSTTSSKMDESRCGVPDTDPDEIKRVPKWDIFNNNTGGGYWTATEITYKFAQPTEGLNGMSAATTQGAILTGFSRWTVPTGRTFRNVTGQNTTPSFVINYVTTNSYTAQANPPPTPFMNFNRSPSGLDAPWTLATLQNVAMHECGHLLGLAHSGVIDPRTGGGLGAMFAHVTVNALSDEDKVPASLIYPDWRLMPGLGIDIGAGLGLNNMDSVWMVDTDNHPNRWDEFLGWQQGPEDHVLTVAKIAVDGSGNPWVVDVNGVVWNKDSNGWNVVPGNGLLTDIAVANAVFGIGLDGKAWSYSLSAGTWQPQTASPANEVAIAVDNNGNPHVLTSAGDIWSATNNVWTLDEGSNGLARGTDIGIGGQLGVAAGIQHVYLIGFGNGIWARDIQPANAIGGGAVARNQWTQARSGLGSRITAGTTGMPWVINSNHQIYRNHRLL